MFNPRLIWKKMKFIVHRKKVTVYPIVLKPGPAGRVDPGMGPVRVEAKTRLGIDPARPGRPG